MERLRCPSRARRRECRCFPWSAHNAMKRQGKAKDRGRPYASRFGTSAPKALTVAKPLAPVPRFVRRGRHMFDRLSSLVIALTLVAIAAIFAALTGGDPLSIALMAVAGFVAAGSSEEHASELQSLMRIPYAA